MAQQCSTVRDNAVCFKKEKKNLSKIQFSAEKQSETLRRINEVLTRWVMKCVLKRN